MTNKDPAFLFYSKDWIEGTAEFSPEEKGVYIDLLAYQHQRGYLPTDTKRLSRMVGLSVAEFDKIWIIISDKFIKQGDKIYNKKLEKVMHERSEKGNRNKVIGTFGYVLKKLNLNKKQEKHLRDKFDLNHIIKEIGVWDSERCTEWCKNAIAFIENENEDGNENEDKDVNKNKDEILFPFNSEKFLKFWNIWKKYKKDEHKFTYKSNISEQAALKKLSELSNGSESKAITIIENSIANGYKGLFEPKNNHNNNLISNNYKQDIINSIHD